jgi:hypothetical protein
MIGSLPRPILEALNAEENRAGAGARRMAMSEVSVSSCHGVWPILQHCGLQIILQKNQTISEKLGISIMEVSLAHDLVTGSPLFSCR